MRSRVKRAANSAICQNEDSLLPLRAGARIAVTGAFARVPRYQGSGSSKVVLSFWTVNSKELRNLSVDAGSAVRMHRESDDSPDRH
ncbi:MAG: hypothetical protein R2912_06500 [Eubacteriales bacterium]